MYIENIEWEELLQKEGEKNFSVSKRDTHYIEFIAKVEDAGNTYLAKRFISKLRGNGEVLFDDQFMPFYSIGYFEDKKFDYYSREFITNECHAEAMGNAHDRRLGDIYESLKNHPDKTKLFSALEDLVKEVSSVSEEIKSATLKAKYGKNQTELLQFPWYALRIFEKLFVKIGFYIKNPKENKNNNYSEYSLPDEFLKKPEELSKKEFFKLLFQSYLLKNNYSEKAEDSKNRLNSEYELFVEEEFDRLKEKGFKKVKRLF